eukprot:scaffold53649_cov83-Phaeocystis_antarctica.AAC.2
MAAELPALQWYVWSPRHEDSARLHPGAQRPTARRQSEAHAANSEGEDALAGEGSPAPPWLSRRSKSMGRADWHARIIRTDSSALSIVCRCHKAHALASPCACSSCHKVTPTTAVLYALD